jgi:Ca2+-binding RTX toxin-like protein
MEQRGLNEVTEDQLHDFLDSNVFNNADTVSVSGATISLLWSFNLGPEDETDWDNNDLAADIQERSNQTIRYIGGTAAGEFLEYLSTKDDGRRLLAFQPKEVVELPSSSSQAIARETRFDQFWHELSEFFVRETDTPLVTITPKAAIPTIFAEDEIPALVNNKSITTINGKDRAELGIDIFSSGTMAQTAYLLSILNGDFAGDLLKHRTARVVQTDDQTFHLELDEQTLAALGIGGSLTPAETNPTDQRGVSDESLALSLLPAFSRGLHAALFGPVMSQAGDKFLDLFGRDGRDPDDGAMTRKIAGEDVVVEKDFKPQDEDLIKLNEKLSRYIKDLWGDPSADTSSLLGIFKSKDINDFNIFDVAEYFRLVAKNVRPFIDDAPEQLKRDIDQATLEIANAVIGAIVGVPELLRERLAVTSGGRLLYLLDQERDATLHPARNLTGEINGVGIVSESETDLGKALYVTLGASTGYAFLRNLVEMIADDATVVPLKAIASALDGDWDKFETVVDRASNVIDRFIDKELDAAGNPFRKAVFASLSYADGKTATQAYDSSLAIGNLLELQVGKDEATLIGNANNNIALHFGHGNVYGLGGNDTMIGINPDVGDDGKTLTLDGGTGNDWVLAFGGQGIDGLFGLNGQQATTVGGLGRDWIYNTTDGGIIWGDVENSEEVGDGVRAYYETEVDADGTTHSVRKTFNDDASNSDNIWYSSNTEVMDAGHKDVLKFYGLTMTGGSAEGGAAGLLVGFGALGGMAGLANLASSTGKDGKYDPAKSVYFDHLLPWMTYILRPNDNGGLDLYVTNILDQLYKAVLGDGSSDAYKAQQTLDANGILNGFMRIRNFDFVGSYLGSRQAELAGQGTMNMVFKAPNVLADLMALIQPLLGLEGYAAGLAAGEADPLIDQALALSAAARRFAEGLKWSSETDPLVIDLDGDGIETIGLGEKPIYFDVDGDLFAEATGWLKGDDGFLVLDANNNGRVDDISEMFGNRAEGGYAELAGYDSNHDGKISVADIMWTDLKVWQDFNSNGVTDVGELKSLADLGIVELNLAATAIDSVTADGTQLRSSASVTFASGNTVNSFEAIFQSNDVLTRYAGQTGAPVWQSDLHIDSKGFGSLTDLSVAMSNDLGLGKLVDDTARAMTTPKLKTLVEQVGAVIGAWGSTQELTRELTPVLVRTGSDGKKELADRGVYVEDSAGGYWTLASGSAIHDPVTGAVIERPTFENVMRQVVGANEGWQAEQSWSPTTRGSDVQFRDDAPYLVRIVEGRVIVDDWGVQDSDGSWHLFSGRLVVDGNGATIAHATIDDIIRMSHFEGQEWRVENIGFNPIANVPVDRIGVRFTDGVAVDYTVQVTDQDGTFYVWARNLDRALELEAKTGDSRGFNLRNYEIDFDHLDEVGSTDDSTYRVELLTPAQFNFALQLGDIAFHPEMLTATLNNVTGHLAYSVNDSGQTSLSPDHYESPITPMIDLLGVAMQEYVVASRRLAVRLAFEGGLKDFAQGITYDIASDKYRPTTSRELAPVFEAIFAGAPATNDNDAAYDYLADWNEILWQVYPDYAPSGEGNLFGSTVAIDQAFIFQMMLPAFENAGIPLDIKTAAHALSIDETRIITHAAGDATVHGTDGSDFFVMSAGDQVFDGGIGSDYYFVGKNSGNDRIYDQDVGDNDELRFTEVDSKHVTARREGQDLILTFNDGTNSGSIVVTDQFLGELNGYTMGGKQFETGVNSIVFADGVIWDRTRLAMMVAHPADTEDFIIGSGSGDVLWGGKGNDVLSGGAGGDYYIFSRGDGQDVISEDGNFSFGPVKAGIDFLAFKGGITADDLYFIRKGGDEINNLYIYIRDENGQINRDANGNITNDGVKIRGQFAGVRLNLSAFSGAVGSSDGLDYVSSSLIERFIFDDGTSLDFGQVAAQVLTDARTDGADEILGFVSSDTLDGGAGNDVLKGYEGGDTYFFGRGYGYDIIEDRDLSMKLFGAADDTLKFIDDLRWTDFDYVRDGASDTLTLRIKGTADQVTLTHYLDELPFIGYTNMLEKIAFGDGTTWTALQLLQHFVDVSETSGDDNVFGFDGIADTIEGGAGNDALKGFGGNDVYIFKPGDGHDIIEDNGGEDRLELRGIASSDVVFTRTALDLVITVKGSGESIVLQNQYVRDGAQQYAVESLVFSDRTISFSDVNPEDIDLDLLNGSATPGNDHIIGSDFAETLDGREGDDTLEGGDGGDIYKYDIGYGNDTIIDTRKRSSWGDRRGVHVPVDDTVRFGTALSQLYAADPSSISFTRDGADLLISIRNHPGDTLRIQNQFGGPDDGVEKFTFTNGMFLTGEDVRLKAEVPVGNRGNNTITGSIDLPNTLDGGPGTDLLIGGNAADTYGFSTGYDNDEIEEQVDRPGVIDTVVFGASVRAEDLKITRNGDDLVISLGNGLDILTIVGGITNHRVEQFHFATGPALGIETILDRMLTGADGDDNLVGVDGRDDTISGGRGSDALAGGSGNDTYKFGFGDGDDSIDDGAGIDRIVFGAGVTQDQVRFQNVNGDLLVTLSTGSDRLVVLGGYSTRPVESFVFADNSALSLADVRTLIRDQLPFSGQDLVDLRELEPGAAIAPGTGNDRVLMANDSRVIIHAGDGLDRIEMPAGVTRATVEFADAAAADAVVRLTDPDGQDLAITFPATGDQVIIAGALGAGAVPTISFSDGTSWDSATLVQRAIADQSSDGDDIVLGSSRGDVLRGGLGDDQLRGGAGDDIYEYRRGDGRDVIEDWSGSDTLKISGYRPDELVVRASAPGRNELLLTFGTDGDAVLLRYDQFLNGIDKVQFGDGSLLTRDQLFDMVVGTGTDGDDILIGTGRPETFDGGFGNDLIQGNGGADVFHFDRGDGQDRIQSNGSSDGLGILEFGQGIAPEDIAVSRDSSGNIILSVIGGDDRVILIDPVDDVDPVVVRVCFAGGTSWTAAELALRAAATAGDDHIIVPTEAPVGGNGSGANVAGAAGNDWLEGGRGNDILDGGKGDDRLEGKNGADTYYFQRGDGQDVVIDYDDSSRTNIDRLRFGPGIALSDLKFEKVGPSDLVISLVGTADRVTIKNMFDETFGQSDNGIEEIAFADSSAVLSLQQIYDLLGTGTAGDDQIDFGTIAAATTLDGRGGDDVLAGGSASNSYKFDRGYGRDTIREVNSGNSVDTLLLGAGLLPSDILVVRSGSDIVLKVRGTSDQLTIAGQNAGWAPIEQVIFSNSVRWTAAQLQTMAISAEAAELILHPASGGDPFAGALFTGAPGGSGGGTSSGGDDWVDPGAGGGSTGGGSTGGGDPLAGTEGNDTINGTALADTINGLGGNDTIHGNDGADTIDGGIGNDTIYGDDGDDQLSGGAGVDYIYGLAGNDTIDGGADYDRLYGGDGDDVINAGDGGAYIEGNIGDAPGKHG